MILDHKFLQRLEERFLVYPMLRIWLFLLCKEGHHIAQRVSQIFNVSFLSVQVLYLYHEPINSHPVFVQLRFQLFFLILLKIFAYDVNNFQWVYGFIVFFYPGGTAEIRRESLPWHVLFGIFVYILAIATATLGFLEKLTFLENSGLAKYGSEAFLVNFTAIVTVLYGTFVLLTALSQGPSEDDYSYSAIWRWCCYPRLQVLRYHGFCLLYPRDIIVIYNGGLYCCCNFPPLF